MSPKCWRSVEVVEVDAVDLVDHLAHELAGLHVVVGVFEDIAHDAAATVLGRARQFLERGKQLIVDEGHERLAGDAFGIGRPGAPLKLLRDGRPVVLLHRFQFLILVVDDLEKEHPAELGDALGIAIDADCPGA